MPNAMQQEKEASTSYRVGILTISDTASRDASLDKSGPLIETLFSAQGYEVSQRAVVADDVGEIQRQVREWIDLPQDRADVVICTGGTGLGRRDVTPESIEPLIDKPTNGLTQALISYSLTKTPLAALSRLTSGIRHRRPNPSTLAPHSREGKGGSNASSLIVTLPGSSKAVKECCEVLLASDGLLHHALDLLQGGDGREKHRAMQVTGTETDTGRAHQGNHRHHHHHHHDHSHHSHSHGHGHQIPKPRTVQTEATPGFKTHDPTQSITTRHRSSPYPIISMDEAMKIILKETRTNETVTLPVNSALRGCILAEDVNALSSLPPRATTNVDGYALSAAHCPPGVYRVTTRESDYSKADTVFRINTGQALPRDADAVIMVEDTDLVEHEGGEEKTIRVKAQVDVGENIRAAGSDVQVGQLVLRQGLRIGELGGEIGTLAFLGHTSISVYRKPKVAILSTGNELYDAAESSAAATSQDAWGFRVFDSNRPSLRAALEGQGLEVVDLGIVGDDIAKTMQQLNKGLEEADVVLSTGGTSMGESDLLKPLMERSLRSGKVHFGRVAMKPGKPTTFASAEASNGDRRLLFALPGNPASALVCFYVFVLPCLRKMSGFPDSHFHLPKIKVRLQDEMRCDPRPEFHRVVVQSRAGELWASSTGSQRSSGMHSMATANGLVCVPSASGEGAPKSLRQGSMADVILLGSIV